MAIQQQAAKIINLSDQSLTEYQTGFLKLGLAFTPIPRFDLNTMEKDLFAFIYNFCLIYHFTDINEDEINPDQSLLKSKLTWTPPFNKNKESKNLTRNLSNFSTTCISKII